MHSKQKRKAFHSSSRLKILCLFFIKESAMKIVSKFPRPFLSTFFYSPLFFQQHASEWLKSTNSFLPYFSHLTLSLSLTNLKITLDNHSIWDKLENERNRKCKRQNILQRQSGKKLLPKNNVYHLIITWMYQYIIL